MMELEKKLAEREAKEKAQEYLIETLKEQVLEKSAKQSLSYASQTQQTANFVQKPREDVLIVENDRVSHQSLPRTKRT